MKFQSSLLWINSALFILFGICFTAAPAFFADFITDATPATSSALIDMRAVYGGMGLGTGLFFGFCAQHSARIRIGLIASLLMLTAIAATRLVGFFADGSPNPLMLLQLGAELLFVVLFTIALRQARAE
jgi:hypothetical protein